MKVTRKVSRRSFLTVVGGAVAGAAAMTVGTKPAMAQTGVTNRDPSDPANNGRTGYTDRDPGDRANYGRGTSVRPGQELDFRAPGNQVRIPTGQVQQYRYFNGRQQFQYQGRWYNLIGTDGSTLIGTDGGT